jgi:hypothetical protein
MRIILLFSILFLALSGLGRGSGFAVEKIRVALYFGENEPPPHKAVLAPEKLHHRLYAVFGFKHYELIKEEEFQLGHEWEQWFVPRKDFFIRVEPLHRQPGEPRVIDYEIYKDGFIVAKGKFEPHEDTPLFINGPDFHQGRFIFMLESR